MFMENLFMFSTEKKLPLCIHNLNNAPTYIKVTGVTWLTDEFSDFILYDK